MKIAGFGFRHIRFETLNRQSRNGKSLVIRHRSKMFKLGIQIGDIIWGTVSIEMKRKVLMLK